ncbi:MAG: hypothetical protein ACJA0W_003775 [Candidatus Azotimanducaceae bacterium]
MNRHFDHIALGGGVASLVTTIELLKLGATVALVAPPPSIGGHFSEKVTLDERWDRGMVLLEFDSYYPQSSDLESYNASNASSAGAYADVVEAYLAPYFKFRRVEKIETAVSGSIIPDYFIANDLQGLPMLFNAEQRATIIAELQVCVASSKYHPRNKSAGNTFSKLHYNEASLSNHGYTLHHHLFNPLVRRASNMDSREIMARHHRLVWAPLYYPETLLDVFLGGCQLKPTQFHYPFETTIGSFAQMLFQQILSYIDTGQVVVIDSLNSMSTTAQGWVINEWANTNNLSSTLAHSDLANHLSLQTDSPKKSSYMLVFLRIRGDLNCEVVFNNDPDYKLFRLTNQTRLKGIADGFSHLVVEYNLDYVMTDEPSFVEGEAFLNDIRGFINKYLPVNGFDIIGFSVDTLINKLTFPTEHNIHISEQTQRFLATTNIALMGASLGMTGTSLNDQLIQALKYVDAAKKK